MQKVKNRWLIALSAVGIHLSIGSAYAWSVFTNPLADAFGWSTTEISLAFSIAIFFLGTSAAFMGSFVEKRGPRISGMLAALFFGVGIISSGLATTIGSLSLLYLTYGVIGGDRFRDRLYFTRFNPRQMVPRPSWARYRTSYYGLWVCCLNYRSLCR